MTQKQCSLYRVTNKVNGKMYIGMTTNPKHRWTQHKCHSNRGGSQVLAAAMRKHGKENFAFDVLMTEHGDDCIEKCRDAEVLMIALINTKAPIGYNLTDGGEGVFGYVHSAEMKKANSERQKRIWTDEHKAEASATSKLYFTQETTRATADERRKAAKDRATAFWEKDRARALGVRSDKVRCVQTGVVFDSASAAARWVAETRAGASYGGILKVCDGISHIAYGLQWAYAPNEPVATPSQSWGNVAKLGLFDIKQRKPKPEKTLLTSEKRSALLREAYAAGKMDNRKLRMKAVMCVETGVVYKSCRDALRGLGKASSAANVIGAVANGKRKSAYGHTWKFMEKETV